jgi:hypothetical protein
MLCKVLSRQYQQALFNIKYMLTEVFVHYSAIDAAAAAAAAACCD